MDEADPVRQRPDRQVQGREDVTQDLDGRPEEVLPRRGRPGPEGHRTEVGPDPEPPRPRT